MTGKLKNDKEKDESGTRDDLGNEGSSDMEATDGVTAVNSVQLVPFHMNVLQLQGWEKVSGNEDSLAESSGVTRHIYSVSGAVKVSTQAQDACSSIFLDLKDPRWQMLLSSLLPAMISPERTEKLIKKVQQNCFV